MGFRFYNQKKRSSEGFTLLELLVVLVILGLMSTVVLVALPGSRETLDIKAAARGVMIQMIESRNQAIRTSRDVRFFLNIAQGEFWTEDSDSPQKIPEGVEMEVYTAKSEQGENNTAAIRFFPDGSSTGGYVRLSRGKTIYRIDVNWLTGKVVMDHEKEQD